MSVSLYGKGILAKLDMYVHEFVWQCREPPFTAAMKHELLFTDYLDLENVADKPVSCKDVF